MRPLYGSDPRPDRDGGAPDFRRRLVAEIVDRRQRARAEHHEAAKAAPNSYGAGYELGYADALGELLEWLTDQEL